MDRKADILFRVEQEHTLIIIDVPRADVKYLNYGLLETLKDGQWTTSKYEGSIVNRKEEAHVIVMMNEEPN